MWAGSAGGASLSSSSSEPLLCDDLGELEGCLGVEDGGSRYERRRSLISPAALYNGSGRLQRAASTCMQLAQEKMLVLSGARKKQPAVESSHTFAEAERQVGSAEWCGLQCTGAYRTPTQLAAAQWAARNKSLAERSETASVSSAAETVRDLRDRERKPVSSLMHTVTALDNISGITVKYDITVEELIAVNKPATRASLLARKTIRIPVFAEHAHQGDTPPGADLDSPPPDVRGCDAGPVDRQAFRSECGEEEKMENIHSDSVELRLEPSAEVHLVPGRGRRREAATAALHAEAVHAEGVPGRRWGEDDAGGEVTGGDLAHVSMRLPSF
jgi:hypothetical protein